VRVAQLLQAQGFGDERLLQLRRLPYLREAGLV